MNYFDSLKNIEKLLNGIGFLLHINFEPNAHLIYTLRTYLSVFLKACWWSYRCVLSGLSLHGVRLFLFVFRDYFVFVFSMILEKLVWISSFMGFSFCKKGTKFKIYCTNIAFWPSCVKWFRSKLFESQVVCHLPA